MVRPSVAVLSSAGACQVMSITGDYRQPHGFHEAGDRSHLKRRYAVLGPHQLNMVKLVVILIIVIVKGTASRFHDRSDDAALFDLV